MEAPLWQSRTIQHPMEVMAYDGTVKGSPPICCEDQIRVLQLPTGPFPLILLVILVMAKSSHDRARQGQSSPAPRRLTLNELELTLNTLELFLDVKVAHRQIYVLPT